MSWIKRIRRHMRKPQLIKWSMLLIPIPIGILNATWLSNVVTNATQGNIAGVVQYGVLLLFSLILLNCFEAIMDIIFQQTSSVSSHQCKMELYDLFLNNSANKLYAMQFGEGVERFNDDFTCVTSTILNVYPAIWCNGIALLTYMLFLMVQNPMIAGILLVISFIQIVPPLVIKHFLETNYNNCRDIEAEIASFTAEAYHGFSTIKLFHLKQWWNKKLREYHMRYSKIGEKNEVICAADDILTLFADNILKYGTYGLIGLFILWGYITPEVGVQAIALSAGLFAATKNIFGVISDIGVAKTAQKRLCEWIADDIKGKEEFDSTVISLNNVSVCFDKQTLLNNVSFSLNEGQKMLIKGENGAGKSTLLRAIVGLQTCDSGEITIGGIPVGDYSDACLSSMLFYLQQDDPMFEFSLYELLQMMTPKKIDDAITLALRFGLTEELIYNQPISSLSGGERKKAYLTVAFTVSPPVFLLDEPTNSLDLHGKAVLCDLLEKYSGSAIIISHENIFDAVVDTVYSISKGEIERAIENQHKTYHPS